jgi:hypothetical protein
VCSDGNNETLEALKALQYEGSRAEVAQGFRERGNEMAKAKLWKDGKEFYTKAIAVLMDKKNFQDAPDAQVVDLDEERQKEREVEEACYINRALCNLELRTYKVRKALSNANIRTENYRSTTLDCAATLRLNPRNVKAYYRSCLALLALDKIPEAQDVCSRGLKLEPPNSALKAASTKISSRQMVLEGISQKKKAEQDKANREKLTLMAALRAREIKMRSTDKPPNLEDAVIHLSPDPLSPESHVVFPVVILYPLHAQSDFIKVFHETETVTDHLKYIFPLPWDSANEYKIGTVDCYMETITGGLIKAGKKLSLLKILSSGKVEVVDGLVKINVVPSGGASKWVEEMKSRRSS